MLHTRGPIRSRQLFAAALAFVFCWRESNAGAFGLPYQVASTDGYFVATGDMNGDGRPDLIFTGTGNAINKLLSIALNTSRNGQLSFASPYVPDLSTFPPTSYADTATAADLNGDGKQDLIVTNLHGNAVTVLMNMTERGSDSLMFEQAKSFVTSNAPGKVLVTDIDADGNADLVITTEVGLSVLLNQTPRNALEAVFATQVEIPTVGATSVAIGDINLDGRPDLVIGNGVTTVAVLLNETVAHGAVKFSEPMRFVSGSFPRDVALADIDGDGRLDVLVANNFQGTVSILANTTPSGATTASFASAATIRTGPAPMSIASEDFNGDGRPDLVVADSGHGGVSVFLNSNGNIAQAPLQVLFDGWDVTSVAVADFDGDGIADVVFETPYSDPASVALNDFSRTNLDQHALTGSWYNPATSGQGFEIEVYPDLDDPTQGILFAGWFTYDTTIAGGKRWYAATGLASSQNPTMSLQIYDVESGNFAAPPSLGAHGPLGSARLQFADCEHGAFAYRFDDGRSGTIPLVRLTPNVNCTMAGDDVHAETGTYGLSGNWFDPAASGQGLIFDFAPSHNLVFAAWYTFAQHGEQISGPSSQRWYTLQSDRFVPGVSSLSDFPIVDTSGGVFDKSTPITSKQVGSADIAFQNCNAMTLTYRFTDGENKGLSDTLHLRRAGPVPSICNL